MDPTTCMREMNAAREAGDKATAKDRAGDLLAWIAMGGFPPEGYTREEAANLASLARAGR